LNVAWATRRLGCGHRGSGSIKIGLLLGGIDASQDLAVLYVVPHTSTNRAITRPLIRKERSARKRAWTSPVSFREACRSSDQHNLHLHKCCALDRGSIAVIATPMTMAARSALRSRALKRADALRARS
jgi:hypothetical protein